jgi:hypothetical protein
MRKHLLRFFAAVLLVLSLSLPFAAGQPGSGLPTVERGTGEVTSESGGGSNTAALPYFVMAVYTMLVLTIVCMPSRKA